MFPTPTSITVQGSDRAVAWSIRERAWTDVAPLGHVEAWSFEVGPGTGVATVRIGSEERTFDLPEEALGTTENDDSPEAEWSRALGDGGEALLVVTNTFSSTLVRCSVANEGCEVLAQIVPSDGYGEIVTFDGTDLAYVSFGRAAVATDGRGVVTDSVGRLHRFGLGIDEPIAVADPPIGALAIRHDARFVAVGTHEASIVDPATGATLLRLPGIGQPLVDLAFAPDGRTLSGVTEQGVLLVWDVPLEQLSWPAEALDPTECTGAVGEAPPPFALHSDSFDASAGQGEEHVAGLVWITVPGASGARFQRRLDTEPLRTGMTPDGTLVAIELPDTSVFVTTPFAGTPDDFGVYAGYTLDRADGALPVPPRGGHYAFPHAQISSYFVVSACPSDRWRQVLEAYQSAPIRSERGTF